MTTTPRAGDDLAPRESERMPVYVHVIDHPDARLLVDTGMTQLHPAVADLDPRLRPLSEQDFDLAGVDLGRPIYVQRRDLDDARSRGRRRTRAASRAPTPPGAGTHVAVWSGELDEPQTEGQVRVRALDPELVWLTHEHEHEPWRRQATS